ncbi:MAG: response regulator [Polyangiaceae bacterium]|nr:response regulator [Polyangiaceae bacterium]
MRRDVLRTMADAPAPESFDLAGLDPAAERIVALVLRLLAGDFAARGALSGAGDGTDAILTALNMLGESFGRERDARARAEALLADAVASYELAPDAFCSCDVQSLHVLQCNGSLARAVGRSASELVGTPLLSLIAPASHGALHQALAELRAGRPPKPLDVELLGATGTHVASVTGAMVRDDAGAPRRYLLSLRDETDRRALAARLARAERLDALGRLAGGVAHDFNNLLTVILASADLVSTRLADRPRDQAELVVIRDTASRAAELIRDLLAFARQESVAVTQMALDGVVRDAAPMLARLVGHERRLEIELGAGDATIVTGPGRIAQALVNLVVNARDALPPGGSIWVTTRRRALTPADRVEHPDLTPGDHVELVVRDDGPGLPAEVQARLFEPFVTTKPVGQGTGLGLSIVYGVVRRAGGSIRVVTAPGKGSTFEVVLPLASSRDAGAHKLESTRPPVGSVLVVDDDPLVRRLMARALRSGGYAVAEAESGAAAIELVRTNHAIDCVVSDVMMPELDGLATLAAVRELRPALPCLFVTGFTNEMERIRGLERVDVLEKPFLPAALLGAVAALWGRG